MSMWASLTFKCEIAHENKVNSARITEHTLPLNAIYCLPLPAHVVVVAVAVIESSNTYVIIK